MKKSIFTELAPQVVGPYSQAIEFENTVYVSGQIPIDPKTNSLIEGSITEQVDQIMLNIKTILESVDLTLDNILKTSIFVTDMTDYPLVNEAYAKHLSQPYPARETVCVVALPMSSKVEISVIAGR